MSLDKQHYGDSQQYQEHLLEQYKLYVEMADRISQRRMTTNTFFMSVNTFLVAFMTLLNKLIPNNTPTILVVAVCGTGIIFSLVWFLLLQNYDRLNTAKFKVVHKMEEELPCACYDVEWTELGRGADKKKYWPLSKLERLVLPCGFGVLYLILLIWFEFL